MTTLADNKMVPSGDHFCIHMEMSSGLSVRIRGGMILTAQGPKAVNNNTLTLTPSVDNFVEIDDNGVISARVTNFTTSYTPLYIITTNADYMIGIEDWRGAPRIPDLIQGQQDGMCAIGTITVSGGDATKFKTTTTAVFQIAGVYYTKAATDALVFSTAGTINVAGAAGTAHWGAWVVQIDSAGAVTTRAVGGGTTDQDYATEALAKAAAVALGPASAKAQLGVITVQGLASTSWVAITSNLTVGGGAGNCTARSFYDIPQARSLQAVVIGT
jgi:hypothetical protein